MSSIEPEPWYASHMQCYSTHSIPNDRHGTLSHETTFKSVAMNPEQYLAGLQHRAEQLGARCLTADLPTIAGLAGALHATRTLVSASATGVKTGANIVMINCTGLAAKELCGDEAVYSIRGQTLLVRITPLIAQEILLYDAGDVVTYIVPRPGNDTFILGGTKDANNYDPVPTPEINAGIIERCKGLLTTRGHTDVEFEVIQQRVGFRPGRKGGARVEVEKVELVDGEMVKVVHNYGHGGTGYQGSIGSAKKVLRMVKEQGIRLGSIS
jgi:D-amino-acid oxidase